MPQPTRKHLGLFLAGAFLLLAIPLAYSQSGVGGGETEEDATKLSGEEQLAKSKKRYEAMEQALKQIEGLQEVARREKAVLRLDCISQKLTEVRELFKIVRPGLENLEQAVKDGNASGRLHEYTKISIAHERTMELVRQAETCAGEEVTYAGDTIVECTTDDGTPCEDIGPDPTDPGFGEPSLDRPTDFSPMQ